MHERERYIEREMRERGIGNFQVERERDRRGGDYGIVVNERAN